MKKKTKYQTPYEDYLPPLAEDQFNALKASIEQHGVRHPVIVDTDGNVIDGHHRLKIDPNAPVQKIDRSKFAEPEIKAIVFEANYSRRHMTSNQRQEVAKRMKEVAKELRKLDAKKWTEAAIAKRLGVSREAVNKWLLRNGKSTNTHHPKPDARVKLNPDAKKVVVAEIKSGKSMRQVAANFGVEHTTISRLVAKEEKKEEVRAKRRAYAEAAAQLGDQGVIVGDFRKEGKVVADGSVSLIFTDPPYHVKYLDLYDGLGEFANRTLIDGGSLVTFCNQHHLPDVVSKLTTHGLTYWWMFCVEHSGGRSVVEQTGVSVAWKPMIWLIKGKKRATSGIICDLIKSTQEKDGHDWQQSKDEAAYCIRLLSNEGELIVDPFCGSGTTAIVARSLGRKWLTFEIEKQTALTARGRIAES